jgi:hypothetical protein
VFVYCMGRKRRIINTSVMIIRYITSGGVPCVFTVSPVCE